MRVPKSKGRAAGTAVLAAACVATSLTSLPAWAQEQAADQAGNGGSEKQQPATAPTSGDPELFNELLNDAAPAPAAGAQGNTGETAAEPAPAQAQPASPASEPELLPTIPLAQEKKSPPPKEEPASSRQIEEIVVTATKREESLREIPQSIMAISGAKLEEGGKLNLIDFIQETPGVTATQGNSGYTRFTMRGISTDTAPTSPSPSPVGVFIGDTAFTDPYIANIVPDLSAFDLSGVQVLKGPQGTLFGGAALSGAVRYELQQPVLGEWQARGFTQLVSPTDGSVALTSGVAVNAPLYQDTLALRLAYVRRNYPGVIDDARTGQKDVDHGSGNQYRAILLWHPENWTLKATHLSQDFYAPNAVYTADSPDGPRSVSTNIFETPAKNKFGMDTLEVAYDFDSMRVVSLSSHLFKDSVFTIDATPALLGKPPMGYPQALGLFSPCTENSKAFSQELRLQSTDSGAFQWLAGAYLYSYRMYFNLLIDTPTNQALLGQSSPLYQLAAALGLPASDISQTTTFFEGTSNVTSTEHAGFFDLSYRLWDRLTLTAGARFYQTKVAGGFIGTGLLLRLENDGMNSDTTNEISEHGINPKVTATFNFTDDISMYGQVAKGFRFGGIQYVPSTPTNGVPATFKSDSLWNHELGLRTTWLDRTLNADLTLFYIKYKDPIITQATQGIPINYNNNVSAAISRGLEASLLWNTPVDGLTLSASAALTDAHITAPFTAADGQAIKSGQQMPGTAPRQYHGSIQYLRPLGFLNVGANAGYNYVGQGYSDLQHSIAINGYGTFDAGLIFSSDAFSFHPKLAINIGNIANVTKPNAGGVVKPIVPIGNTYVYGLIPPRTLSLRLSIDL